MEYILNAKKELDTDKIELPYNYLSDDYIKPIINKLCTNTTVHDLDLSGNILKNLKDISEMLKVNKTLRVLCLFKNSITIDGIINLVESLCVNSSLHCLDLSDCNIGKINNDVTSALLQINILLKTNKSLRCLLLESNSINSISVNHIADSLRTNKNLKELNLNHNKINSEGFGKLLQVSKENSCLKILYLQSIVSNRTESYEMTKQLILNQNIQLRVLNLDNNMIDADGAKNIADFLIQNDSLESLSLRRNFIGDGTIYIFNSLKINSRLYELDLSNNNLCYDNFKQISDSMPHINLVDLNLSYNGINIEGAVVIAESLCSNCTLQKICVFGFHDRSISNSMSKIAEILESNYTLTDILFVGDKNDDIDKITERNKQIAQNIRFIKTKCATIEKIEWECLD